MCILLYYRANKMMMMMMMAYMILVCGLYAITWAPVYIYSLLKNLYFKLTIGQNSLLVVLSIGYIYICVNPFIYAIKFDPVKRVLLGLIPCKQNTQQDAEPGGNT